MIQKLRITTKLHKNLFNGGEDISLARQSIKCVYGVDNFMIWGNLDIFKITSGDSPWSNTIVFSIEKNEINIEYLKDNFDKEFHIFVDKYLYKCYKIQEVRCNKNDITVVVDEFDDMTM